VSDNEGFKQMALDFFQNLYAEEVRSSRRYVLPSYFPELYIEFLLRRVSLGEIFFAIMSMGPYKAPGDDGYHAVFYQRKTMGSSWGVLCATWLNFPGKETSRRY